MEIKDFSLEDIDRLSEIADDPVVQFKEALNKKNTTFDRFSTGFEPFNEVMEKGFKEGDLVIISGISGQGKTSFAQTLTYNLCQNAIPCLWFSYETSLNALDSKFEKMGIANFYFVYVPKKNTSGKLEWIKYKIRESWIKFATKIVFIDHIDFLTPSSIKDKDNETIAYKKIATELKNLAVELNVVIIAMAHTTKIYNNREPEMQDISWSSGIFQFADYVFMVMRENIIKKGAEKYKAGEGETQTNRGIIKLVKNRETGITKYIVCRYVNNRFIQETKNYEPTRNQNYYEPVERTLTF